MNSKELGEFLENFRIFFSKIVNRGREGVIYNIYDKWGDPI